MSFIVKGIDFPEKCGDCPCCVEYDNGVCIYSDNYNTGMYCSAQDSAPDVYDINKKLNNCQLVEIPTPHGRLIDADRLMEVIEKNSYLLKGYYNSLENGMFFTGIKQAIDEAPTIIEAEVE